MHQCRRLALKRSREMQDTWTVPQAEKIQGYANHNESKNFFAAIKTIYSPPFPTKGTATLPNSDGSRLLMEKSQILKRWIEYFRSVLIRPSTISDAVTDEFPQAKINTNLDFPPSLPETTPAMQQRFNGEKPRFRCEPS
nr:unnamed protein product [Spirometra erinaceieuropaei]